ncbi:VOC family protein [Aminobacter anthyllidis]|uniref:VOC family protein n=1 Tax=Aminobacter anthyllidis TaxID=1035067 RepID=A0A9X1AC20_9HYPH|nr:VOC family protein [Aminobacter anthyllidis]MBT1157150.1 VOC family protein [Aminobacter anthyllidis]
MDEKVRTAEPHLDELFNIGLKAPKLDEELKFLSAFNPDRTYKVQFGPKQIDAVELGGVKFFLFQALSYDEYLPAPHPGGVGHVSFMVDDLDELLEHLERHGIKPFRGPYEGQLGELGKRMVAMFRSPNGTLVSTIPRNPSKQA